MTPDTKPSDARVEAMAVELSHIVRGQRVLLSGRERTVKDIARAILAADATSAQQAALMFNGLTEDETTRSASVAGLRAAPSDAVCTWQGFADADKYKALAESASQAAPSGEAVTLSSAVAALNHVAQYNGAGRKAEAMSMLEPATAPAESVRTNAVQARKLDPLQDPMRPGYFMNYQQDETPAEQVLRKLACWLGVGGYNAPKVDADLFHRKIVGAIQDLAKEAASPPPSQPPSASNEEKKS